MYSKDYTCLISYKKEIVQEIIDMKVISKEICQQAKPGQFLNIKCCDGINTILRRPISICDIDKKNHELRFIFQIKGQGTSLLAGKNIGQTIDILAPLGKPFTISEEYTNPLLIGGGIGIFPLLYLAKSLPNKPITYLGFRNKDMLLLKSEFLKTSKELKVATDDGSYGHGGYVTDLLQNKVKENNTNKKVDIIYACGPTPLLKLIKEMANKYKIPAQLSLEQRMGCGIGACLVCACKIKTSNNTEEYKRICKDGPVFWGDEVIFDD